MSEGEREARLKPEFQALYPRVPAGEWKPAAAMLDMVTASRLLTGRRSGEILGPRILDAHHFEFRGGFARPSGSRRRIPQ
jgi:hypothetical protein